jgi:hypothetical protein
MKITNPMIKYAHSRSEWAMFAIIVSGFKIALNDVATTHVMINGIVRAKLIESSSQLQSTCDRRTPCCVRTRSLELRRPLRSRVA